jgi:predicted RNA-binding protein with RPS1 domain
MKTTLLRAILIGFVAHSTLGFSSEVSDKMDVKAPSIKNKKQKNANSIRNKTDNPERKPERKKSQDLSKVFAFKIKK